MSYYDKLREDSVTSSLRPDIQLSLTDMQYERLLRKSYEIGLNAPGKLLADFVADLTGCHSHGVDECDLANDWFRRTYMLQLQTAYFRLFLAETYPYANEYREILNDEDWLSELYEDYVDWGIGLILESREACKAVLKELSAEYEIVAEGPSK